MEVIEVSVNAVGLPALPDELFLLIVSFFPTLRIPEETRGLHDNGYAPRHKTLLVLTMTCRALRRVCLPLLWQRVEARAGMQSVADIIPTHGGSRLIHDKSLSREVLRQLATVTVREPKYAVYVHIINIDIGAQSTDTLVQEILTCLELFPQLHTVRLKTSGSRLVGKDIERTRRVLSSWRPKAPLLSIQRWFSNQLLSQVMSFCPNLHTAGGLIHESLELGQLLRVLAYPMVAVERLENVSLPFNVCVEAIAERFPNLRHLGLRTGKIRFYLERGFAPFGQTLAAFENLDCVNLRISSESWPTEDSWRDELSAGPIMVLSKLQEADGRVKRFGLRESTLNLTRRVYDIVLPLDGNPTWTKGEVKVQP